ncbi:MAG TPA: hypothetical protein VIK53_17240 [Verrucomicrobiae bacterium]
MQLVGGLAISDGLNRGGKIYLRLAFCASCAGSVNLTSRPSESRRELFRLLQQKTARLGRLIASLKNYFALAALTLAQRALAAAAILARASADNGRLTFLDGAFAVCALALILAQRAFCAARILAMPAALIFFLVLTGLPAGEAARVAAPVPPARCASCFCSVSIFSLSEAACLSCDGVRLVMFMELVSQIDRSKSTPYF